jgi:hypothetical protein
MNSRPRPARAEELGMFLEVVVPLPKDSQNDIAAFSTPSRTACSKLELVKDRILWAELSRGTCRAARAARSTANSSGMFAA